MCKKELKIHQKKGERERERERERDISLFCVGKYGLNGREKRKYL